MHEPATEIAPPLAAEASSAAPRRDALVRLTPLGWQGGLALILGLLAASFVLLGYFVVYWRNADMDFMVVYNALVLNDGKPQSFFDHPAYLTILSVKLWFQLMHGLGLLDADRLSAIPPAANVGAFDAAMTSAVRAGRVVAWLTASIFVLVFGLLMRRLTRDWRVALLATFAFAFSGGVAMQLRALRSEMVAACLVLFAFMILIAAARRARSWRPLALAIAAALCVLGLENKVQVILLIAALPLLVLPFGSSAAASRQFWRKPAAWLATGLAAVIAVALVMAAKPLITTGLDPAVIAASRLRPLIASTFGLYQIAILIWIVLGMVAFAALWRVSVAETVASLFAVTAGAAFGLLALMLQYNPANVVAVINPVEKMLVFAGPPPEAGGSALALLKLGSTYLFNVLERYSFVLVTSPRPAVFLIWLVVPGIIYAWRRGERQVALQCGLLMLTAVGIDTLSVRRGLKMEYFILTDPLIVLAGALLIDRLTDLRFRKWAYIIGVALIVVHVGISQAEPIKQVLKRSGPESICEWNRFYLPLLPMPWCKEPPIVR